MQAEPKIWRRNERISIYYFDVLQIGGVIDHVDVVPIVPGAATATRRRTPWSHRRS